MRIFLIRSICAARLIFAFATASFSQTTYFSLAGDWARRAAEQMKIDAARLKEAVDFAVASEAKAPRDLERLDMTFSVTKSSVSTVVGLARNARQKLDFGARRFFSPVFSPAKFRFMSVRAGAPASKRSRYKTFHRVGGGRR